MLDYASLFVFMKKSSSETAFETQLHPNFILDMPVETSSNVSQYASQHSSTQPLEPLLEDFSDQNNTS